MRSLLPEEIKILDYKYRSKQFEIMNFDEKIISTHALLLKIHVITGWVVPQKELMDILIDQFEKVLSEKYSKYNSDEVEYAFRNFGTQVKDWGKSMNLSMIDEVMSPYMEKRFELSRYEEQKKMLPPPSDEVPMSDQVMIDWLTDVFKSVKENNHRFEFTPVDVYDWLDRRGCIDKNIDVKKKYFRSAIQNRITVLRTKMEERRNIDNVAAYNDFLKMNEEKKFIGNEKELLKRNAKKMFLFDLIQQSENVEKLYERK